jgi:hypothetical protein
MANGGDIGCTLKRWFKGVHEETKEDRLIREHIEKETGERAAMYISLLVEEDLIREMNDHLPQDEIEEMVKQLWQTTQA